MSLDLRNPGRTIHAGVVLTNGITEMLDVAPFEFFAWLDTKSAKLLNFPPQIVNEALDLKLHWVTEDGNVANFKSGAQVKPTDSFTSCPPLDIVLMGAHDPSYHLNDAEKIFIRKSYDECTAFLSICGGVFALLEAGLLEGKTASLPRMTFELMKKNAPHVNWVDKRWAHDGKIWSSSTLLNGLDLIRGFAEEVWGGRSGLVEALLDSGHYPVRDIDFKDDKGHNIQVDSF